MDQTPLTGHPVHLFPLFAEMPCMVKQGFHPLMPAHPSRPYGLDVITFSRAQPVRTLARRAMPMRGGRGFPRRHIRTARRAAGMGRDACCRVGIDLPYGVGTGGLLAHPGFDRGQQTDRGENEARQHGCDSPADYLRPGRTLGLFSAPVM